MGFFKNIFRGVGKAIGGAVKGLVSGVTGFDFGTKTQTVRVRLTESPKTLAAGDAKLITQSETKSNFLMIALVVLFLLFGGFLLLRRH